MCASRVKYVPTVERLTCWQEFTPTKSHIGFSNMNRKIEAYGVKAVKRPKIQAVKFLDLSGISGQQIVKSETKLVLRTHKQTFKKLADM